MRDKIQIMWGSARERELPRLTAPIDPRKRKVQSQQKKTVSRRETLVLLQRFMKKLPSEKVLKCTVSIDFTVLITGLESPAWWIIHCVQNTLVKYFRSLTHSLLPKWNFSFDLDWRNRFLIHLCHVTYPVVWARVSGTLLSIDVPGRHVITQCDFNLGSVPL